MFCLLTTGVARAQYISEVLEYRPAPGQFINSEPWGTPQSASTLVGGINGSVSLGAFGGSLVFKFEDAVENHPDNPFGVDFTIFGNPMSQWSEPGVVWVSVDENGNGTADDTWYELAGSDYYFSSTIKDYRVTYSNPGGELAMDVPWESNKGERGFIRANSAHAQNYYPLADSFPDIPGEEAEYSGTLISGSVDVDHPPLLISAQRAFGYADNQPRGLAPYTMPDNPYTGEVENSGGDAFDISWAVDETGLHVELEKIDFIKVQNGILHEGGYLGEVSTEITGAVDVAPLPGVSGESSLLVIRDLPTEMDQTPVQLEAFLFQMGIPEENPGIRWTCSEPWASVDEDMWLNVSGTGPLTISATVDEGFGLNASVSTEIIEGNTTSIREADKVLSPGLFPNPVGDHFQIRGARHNSLSLYDASGRVLRRLENYDEGRKISCADLQAGIYMIRLGDGNACDWLRMVKQ